MDRIDALTEQAIRGLRKAQNEAATRRVVIVCEPTLDDPLREEVQRLALPCYTIQIRLARRAPKPYLIEVADETRVEAFVNNSLRLAVHQALQPAPPGRRSRSICAWLITTVPVPVLEQQLAERARMLDERRQMCSFRLWDPRTMQHAQRLFGRQPPRSCLPEAVWGLIDAFGQWQLFPAPEGDPVWSLPPLALLRELGVLNAALQRLCAQGASCDADVFTPLTEAIRIGQREGLKDEDDLIHFSTDRVRWKAPIETAPRIRELIEYTRQGQAHYHRVAADYDKADWNAIVQSSEPARPTA